MQSFSHHIKGDFCVLCLVPCIRKVFFFFWWQSAMSHFCNQSCEVNHMLLLWMWWEVSSRIAAQERCPTSFLLSSLSFSTCFSFSSFSSVLHRRRQLHALNYCEKGSVSQYLCVCISRNVCGIVADSFHRIQEFLRHPTQMNYSLESQLWVFIHTIIRHYVWVMLWKEPWITSSRRSSVTHKRR